MSSMERDMYVVIQREAEREMMRMTQRNVRERLRVEGTEEEKASEKQIVHCERCNVNHTILMLEEKTCRCGSELLFVTRFISTEKRQKINRAYTIMVHNREMINGATQCNQNKKLKR